MHARKGSSDEPTASSGSAERAAARRGRSRPLPVAFVSRGARPRRARGARRGDRLGRRRASFRGEPSSRALAPRRSGRGGARRERRRAPHADRACVRRRTGRLASRSHSALAFAATDHRGEPRPGTRPRGRPYRRRGRSDASPRPRATRLRRRSVHLGLGRLLDRSPHGPDQCGDATAHAPRCPGDRDRRQRPERSARNLRSQRTARGEPADRVRGRFASDRSRRRGDASPRRRARDPGGIARCALGRREMRHERYPCPGRFRMDHRRLSRRGGDDRARRAVRRVSRLLRCRQEEPDLPRHRDYPAPRRAVSDLDDRRTVARADRHRAAQRDSHGSDGLALTRDGGARAAGGLCDAFERRGLSRAHRLAAAGPGRSAQCDRRSLLVFGECEARLRRRSRHRRLLGRADRLGACDAFPGRSRSIRRSKAPGRPRKPGSISPSPSADAVSRRWSPSRPRSKGSASPPYAPHSRTGRSVSKNSSPRSGAVTAERSFESSRRYALTPRSVATPKDGTSSSSVDSVLIGRPIPRVEDRTLVLGQGCYTDDVRIPGALHAAVVRSVYAHARIVSVDVAQALAAPGVVTVLTGRDYAADGHRGIAQVANPADNVDPAKPAFDPATCLVREAEQQVIAAELVRHVGEAIAIVIAEDAAAARDAAALVEVTYEELPVVVEFDEAHLVLDATFGDERATAAAFARAALVVEREFRNQRVFSAHMEPRAAIGLYDPQRGAYTLIAGNQGAGRQRTLLAGALGVAPEQVDVVCPDVGGGFGSRTNLHPEAVLVVWAARRVGRPVRWTGDRSEGFATDFQGRDITVQAALALDERGKMLALRETFVGNVGAYPDLIRTVTKRLPH